jgi:malate dehydrogenase
MTTHNKKRIKVAVTGAAGQIGYQLIFRLASGQIFGMDTEVELQLLEIEAALPSLNGVAMELDDCAFPLLKNVVCTSDPNVAFNGVNWCLLVGSVPRKLGMERSDLLKINGNIFVAQGQAINKSAADDVRIFVVGNPCNTNCLIAQHNAPDVPAERFFAMTALDENRAKAQLAKKANVAVTDITNMTIWGNHSQNQYPDFFNAKIKGQPVTEVIKDLNWLKNEFVPAVQQRGTTVIKARGSSSAASAANAAIDGVVRLINPTQSGDSFSVVRISNGEYNVDPGLMFSFPTHVDNKLNINTVKNLDLSDPFAQEKFKSVLDELRQERDIVKSLGLIK